MANTGGSLPELTITGNLQSISLVAWTFILAIGIIALIKYRVVRNSITSVSPTWGCGYTAPNARMQYTASSYVRSFRKLIRPLLIMNKKESMQQPGKLSKRFIQIHIRMTKLRISSLMFPSGIWINLWPG